MNNKLSLAFLCALCASAVNTSVAFAQDLAKRPAPQSQPVAIVNATIHPVSGPAVQGHIVFDGGKIRTVGEGKLEAGPGTRVIDGAGKHVYPGLISARTQLGLEEIASVRATNDFNEAGNITPEATAATAVNPDSTLLPVTRLNGVLAAGVFPNGGILPGRVSVIQMEGWTSEDMTVRRDCGQVLAWPLMRTIRAPWMERSEEDQQRDIRLSLERVRESFRAARAYRDLKAAEPNTPTDLRWEAMRGVFPPADVRADAKSDAATAQLPVYIEAQDFDQITAALLFASEFKLRPIIVGGRDAVLCAEQLKKQNAVVIVTGTYMITPRRDDSAYDEQYTLPARLEAAGVPFVIASGEETPHERNLPYAAAMAVAHGLSRESALRSVTLSAARALGVADRLGSLEAGKDATLIVTDGDPLEVGTVISAAFIQGREISLASKQSALAEKYREKYRQTRPRDSAGR